MINETFWSGDVTLFGIIVGISIGLLLLIVIMTIRDYFNMYIENKIKKILKLK